MNPYSPQPAYVQVAADLRRRITSGELQPGSALPAYRILAGEYGVSVGTVTRAVGIVRDAGLVETGTGFETRVRQPMRRKAAVLKPGQRLGTRMPTPAECEALGIDPGVPVFVLVDEQGQTTPYPGDRWEFTNRTAHCPLSSGDQPWRMRPVIHVSRPVTVTRRGVGVSGGWPGR